MAQISFALLSYVSADPALITPTPRHVQLAGSPVSIENAVIVLAGSHSKLRIGAAEINLRLTEELRTAPLPVTAGGLEQIRAADGPVLVLGVSGKDRMASVESAYRVTVPAKRAGYGIAAHGHGTNLVLILAGHDEQGALHAAVTLRFLLDPAGNTKIPNGQAVLQAAHVQDWPDFTWRQIGKPPANVGIGWELAHASRTKSPNIDTIGARFVREEKQYVDYMLRHKINLSRTHATHLERSGEGQYTYLRAVSDYARARGVEFVEKTHSWVGTYPQDKNDPRKSRCVDHRVHKRYFCWSLLDVHEERAREMATAMKASGFRWLYLHATDGGGWENPARWSERCDECRRIYGNDHARADAAMFGVWYRVLKAQIPDVKMIAVVYPYNANSIDPREIERRLVQKSGAIPNARALARKIAGEHQAFLTRLGAMLPPDIFICQREVTRRKYALMTRCYGKRPFQIYLETKHGRGWNPEFTLAGGWLQTFYRPDHGDIFYPSDNAWGHNYMSELMSAEFGWNVNAPGAREFTNPSLRGYDIDHHIEPRAISHAYIKRFCNDFYGPEIGPHMVAVYDSNISYRYIQQPHTLISNMRIKHPEQRMQQMVDATARAMKALERARIVYDAAKADGREPFPNELGARMFGEMFRAGLVSTHVAPFRLRMLQARNAAIAGDMDKAGQLVAGMRHFIARGRAAWTKCRPWMKKAPIVERRNPNWVYTFGRFQKYDYSKLDEEVTKFEKRMNKLFEAHNTPTWFQKALMDRVLYAVPTKETPVIDGRLTERSWQKAPQNEFFVTRKTSTLAEKQTEARILYDKTGLYVGYTVYEPGADRIPIHANAHDEWISSHSVSLFVDTNSDKQTCAHYTWCIDGSVSDGGNAWAPRGMQKIGSAGSTSKMKSAIARYPDRWTLEAWVPADELGATPRPGKTWRANLCRSLMRADGKCEAASAVPMQGDAFHAPSTFTELHFLSTVPPRRAPIVNLHVEKQSAGERTISDGAGYGIELNISLDTTKPLHNATLTAEVHSGNARKGEFAVFENRNIQLLWRSREPVQYLVPTPEPGLYVDFRLAADQGEWMFHRKYGTPEPRTVPATFVEGISGQALAGTAHFPAAVATGQLFDSRRGTLEMWIRAAPPLQPKPAFGPRPQHVLFFQGPIRYDHPLLDNNRSVCLRRIGARLTGRVSTRDFQKLWVNASIGAWKEPSWHHVAMQWTATDEGELDLYLDGKKASDTTHTNLHGKKWLDRTEPFFVQLGAAITGAGPLGWPIDEVRISAAPRYTSTFTPTKRATLDALTTVVFHFDGNLEGHTQEGTTVTANGGPGL